MAFHEYGKTVSFPRNEHVAIHVRELTLNADAPEGKQVQMIEIREWLKEPEVYAHGIIIPRREIKDLTSALEKVLGR